METSELLNKIQQEIGYIPSQVNQPVITQGEKTEVKSIIPITDPKTDQNQNPKPWLFKKGQTGNPKGRPKKVADFDQEIEEELAKAGALEADGKPITKQQLIIRKMAEKAMKGDVKASQFLAERIKGKPTQKIETKNTNYNLNQTLEQIKGTKVVEAETPDGTPTIVE